MKNGKKIAALCLAACLALSAATALAATDAADTRTAAVETGGRMNGQQPGQNGQNRQMPQMPGQNSQNRQMPQMPGQNGQNRQMPQMPGQNGQNGQMPQQPGQNGQNRQMPQFPFGGQQSQFPDGSAPNDENAQDDQDTQNDESTQDDENAQDTPDAPDGQAPNGQAPQMTGFVDFDQLARDGVISEETLEGIRTYMRQHAPAQNAQPSGERPDLLSDLREAGVITEDEYAAIAGASTAAQAPAAEAEGAQA